MVITMSKSIIAFILAILCAASTSCARQAQTEGDANADTTDAETAELVGREAVSSSVPDTLNFDGETVTILTDRKPAFPRNSSPRRKTAILSTIPYISATNM